jgi:hypothetical protein
MLHKTSKVRGFHLHAADGNIGHVDDFLFDESWNCATWSSTRATGSAANGC